MEIKDEILFLKYALPCINIHVKRGQTTGKIAEELINSLLKNKPIPYNLKDIFPLGYTACALIAKKHNKDVIDENVIRDYFWNEHESVIKESYEQFGDFKPQDCMVLPAKILAISSKGIKVVTPYGEKVVKNTYKLELNKGDFVVVHFDCIVEKIEKRVFETMDRAFRSRIHII